MKNLYCQIQTLFSVLSDTSVTPHMKFFYYKDTFNLLKVNVNK